MRSLVHLQSAQRYSAVVGGCVGELSLAAVGGTQLSTCVTPALLPLLDQGVVAPPLWVTDAGAPTPLQLLQGPHRRTWCLTKGLSGRCVCVCVGVVCVCVCVYVCVCTKLHCWYVHMFIYLSVCTC